MSQIELSKLFQPAVDLLAIKRQEFNLLDAANHNHGDHMLAIFEAASQAAAEKSNLPEAMAYAGSLLNAMPDNGSALIYARGLQAMASQFEKYNIDLENLAGYLRRHLSEAGESASAAEAGEDGLHSADILKALLNALTAWEQAEAAARKTDTTSSRGLDLGYLLGIGMAYMQAKQGGGDKLDVLAETIVASSPLNQPPHRLESGKQVVRAVLAALKNA
jgi:hypothetical protein